MQQIAETSDKRPRDAADCAREMWTLHRDALKLAEQAKPYQDGEQWAVTAVLFLRRETARLLKHACGEGVEMERGL